MDDTRLFLLNRLVDHSGISGVGVVAIGVEFGDGLVLLGWLGELRSVAIYKNMDTLIAVHGHGGDSRIEWVNPATRDPYTHHRHVVLLIAIHAAITSGGLIDTELSWL